MGPRCRGDAKFVLIKQTNRGLKMSDPVNHPDHYTYGGIETIDVLEAKSTPAEFAGYLRLNCMKYLSRAGHKDEAIQDYKKAAWYLNKLIEVASVSKW